MVKRRELKAKESSYQNTDGGKDFGEFHLSIEQVDKVVERLSARAQQTWADVRSARQGVSTVGVMVAPAAEPITAQATPLTSLTATRITSGELTMSSREIAKLTGKRHDHVMVDIRKMLDDLEYNAPEFSGTYKSDQGNEYACFNLPRRETDILLTGYSVPMRAAVIDRWHQLEGQVAKPVANLNDAASLRGLLLGYTEQVMQLEHQVGVQAAKIAEDAPKADYYAHVRDSKNTDTIGAFAKVLGFGRNKLFAWLRDQNILMHDNMPQQKHIDQGHFRVLDKDHTTEKGKKITYKQTVLTGKGKTYVQKRLKKAGNPDLGDDE